MDAPELPEERQVDMLFRMSLSPTAGRERLGPAGRNVGDADDLEPARPLGSEGTIQRTRALELTDPAPRLRAHPDVAGIPSHLRNELYAVNDLTMRIGSHRMRAGPFDRRKVFRD